MLKYVLEEVMQRANRKLDDRLGRHAHNRFFNSSLFTITPDSCEQ